MIPRFRALQGMQILESTVRQLRVEDLDEFGSQVALGLEIGFKVCLGFGVKGLGCT